MNARTEIPADDRRQALEEFAAGSDQPHLPSAPSMAPMMSPVDRVFGAQKVAVYRDDTRVLSKLAALGAAAGDDWFYRFPVKNRRENRTDWIEGASIKLANDVARIYGNCDVDTRVFDAGDHWVIYARFTDFESGFSLTRPFQQRKTGGKIGGEGGDGDARRLDIAFQIGVSKAIRNVVVNALQTYADYAFDAARNSLVEKIGKDLNGWRDRVIQGLGKIPVDVIRAERVIGKPVKEWLAPDVAKVIAMMKAIADGMASADESFPPLEGQKETGATATTETTTDTKTQTASTQAGAGESSPQTAAGQPASGVTESKPSPGAASATEAGTATTTAAESKTTADSATARTEEPIDEKTWAAYADTTIKQLGSAEEGTKWWKDGKSLRNKCNVTEEVREEKKTALDAKVASFKAVKK